MHVAGDATSQGLTTREDWIGANPMYTSRNSKVVTVSSCRAHVLARVCSCALGCSLRQVPGIVQGHDGSITHIVTNKWYRGDKKLLLIAKSTIGMCFHEFLTVL